MHVPADVAVTEVFAMVQCAVPVDSIANDTAPVPDPPDVLRFNAVPAVPVVCTMLKVA